MPQIGPLEILVVGVMALLVFGPEKLPEMGRSLGRGLTQIKRMASEVKSDFDLGLEGEREPAPSQAPALTSSAVEAVKSRPAQKATKQPRRSAAKAATTRMTKPVKPATKATGKKPVKPAPKASAAGGTKQRKRPTKAAATQTTKGAVKA